MKRTSIHIKNILLPGIFAFAALPMNAATTANQDLAGSLTNPLLLVLTAIALVLAFIIFMLGLLLTSALRLKHIDPPATGTTNKLLSLPLLAAATGQSNLLAGMQGSYYGLNLWVVCLFAALIAAEFIIIFIFCFKILQMLKPETQHAGAPKLKLLEKLNASVSIEHEQDIMLDHDYDGIRELDNNLPPWWKYGFYLSIVFAVIYMFYYHIEGSGKLQLEEYADQMTAAQLASDQHKKTGGGVDENTANLLTDKGSLASGQKLFTANCAPCHGPLGQGVVGPNLTDDYWLHGGSIKDIFKSVKYGWPEKGMKSWKQDFAPAQILEISSYIRSIRGTNPANAKEKQGELYQEQADSASVKDKGKLATASR